MMGLGGAAGCGAAGFGAGFDEREDVALSGAVPWAV